MKKKLYELLVDKGICETEQAARAEIMAGNVFIKNIRVDKAGTLIDTAADITLKTKEHPYVSRGGLKLEKALKEFSIDCTDIIAMDIGSSAGGFTDCMLQSGAKQVYAVDVGTGELNWKLRNDKRVTVMEGTNARFLTAESVGRKFDLITCDVSFISLKLILPVIKDLLNGGGRAVVLIKPQFGAEREQVETGGIVRDSAVHKEVIDKVKKYASDNKLTVSRVTESPIKGMKGNTEFLALIE